MKPIFITLFLALDTMSSHAQSFIWCPQGAQWHYDMNWFAQTGYVDLKYVSDTVVDGINCKKLLECSSFYDQQFGTTYPYTCTNTLFTYDSNRVVYCFRYNAYYGLSFWDTLFDFNAIPGQQWHLFLGDSNQFVEVQDTGHINIQSLNLRWMTVIYPNSFEPFITDTIIERIGCINSNYPFYPSVLSTDAQIGGFCNYSDDVFADWRNADLVCTFLPTGIAEQNSETRFRVHPNPADGEITMSTLQTGTLTITNGLGEVLLTFPIKNNRVIVSTENLEGGIYLLRFQTVNGNQTKKLLIQH